MRRTAKIAGAFLASVLLVCGALVFLPRARGSEPPPVDFNRDIRPIFNSQCITCHGGVKQAAGVSFSYREQALGKGKSGRPIVVPGSPGASELIARVTSHDPEVRMPLHGAPLSSQQIALLRRWIKEGAVWQNYWAFVPPKPQSLPAVKQSSWVRQPLDRFILARLEKERLSPAPEADKAEQLRRVSLDLTGMPPTPEEQAAFLADISSNAYEKQVDRLLASPRYGERWASLWLDLARYGDSKGFEKDKSRPGVWPYRDWVIDAFNKNLPYDQFVIKQLAGDLLPNASFDDRIATSFHRQTAANDEGGTDDEEFRLAAVMDRASTTWSVLNGVSFNCVQCHSHPYDPIRHSEYYRFLAFFNTSRDADIAFDAALEDDWPVLHVPTDKADYAQADRLQRESDGLRNDLVAASRAMEARDVKWKLLPIREGHVSQVLAIEQDLSELEARPANKKLTDQIKHLREELARAKGHIPAAAIRVQNGMAEYTGTVPIKSLFDLTATADVPLVTALRIEVPPADAAKARHSPEKGFVVNHIDAWVVRPDGGSDKIEFRLLAPDSIENLQGNIARLLRNMPEQKARPPGEVAKKLAANSGFMADPNLFRTRWVVCVPVAPLHLPPGARLRVQLTHTEPINASFSPVPRVRLLASSDANWTAFAQAPEVEKEVAELEQLTRRIQALRTVPLPVMAEQAGYEQRATLEFERGSFLTQVGPALPADTPALFPKFPAGPRNRLTLARWFFEPGQPLTARVAVNRYWEELFGIGLVESLEDFGSAGEKPSHPELLDWLALHFQNDLHWNTKALLREMVTSAAYRQSARTTPALQKRDPNNRLLAHGPQQRLTAEMVRDQALSASGLLNPKMGGPPVMPLQPKDVWNVEANNPERWVDSTGADRYRRAIYTFIKRTAIYPSFVAFDAADRQLSVPRRIPTNTPLQALVTLNDPVFRQADEALARRMSRAPAGAGDAVDARLNYGARCVLSRDLTPDELAVLRKLYRTAGPTAVASALFNLDAALTR